MRCVTCKGLLPEMGIFALAQTATKFIAGVAMMEGCVYGDGGGPVDLLHSGVCS